MANPEVGLIAWLRAQFPDAGIGVRTPAAFDGPFIRCYITSGGGQWQLQSPIFDVDCFAVGDLTASDLAYQVRDAFTFDLPHTTVDGTAYTQVRIVDLPRRLLWDNTAVSRYGASYQVYLAPAA